MKPYHKTQNPSCCSPNTKNNFCLSHVFEVEAFLCSLKKTSLAVDFYKFLQNK